MSTPRPLRTLVAASGASNLADGALVAWMPLLAVGITRDPTAVAVVATARSLPWLVFALPAGALSDRLDRRRTMLGASLARAVVLAGLAAVVGSGHESIPVLVVVALALGVAETLFDTSAQSIVPALVPPDDLPRANGRLHAVELGANQFVGPPLGSALFAASAGLAVATSSVVYVLAAAVLATLPATRRPAPATRRPPLRTDIVEGLRHLWGHRLLRTLALLVGAGNLAASAAMAVLPLQLVAPGAVGLDERGFGLVLAAYAVGSLLAAPLVGRATARFGRARLLTAALATWAVAGAVPALTTQVAVIVVAFVAFGAMVIAWNVITVSLRQRIVADHLLGRVNASYRLLAWGSAPLGSLLGGAVGASAGLSWVFVGAGVVTAACVPVCRRVVTEEAIARAEADVAPPPSDLAAPGPELPPRPGPAAP